MGTWIGTHVTSKGINKIVLEPEQKRKAKAIAKEPKAVQKEWMRLAAFGRSLKRG